jgi:RNA polymerase sigma factor (sigma-70 family)
MIFDLLTPRHKEWVLMAISQGASPEIAEDIVQDMYLRLNKYVKDPNRIMYGAEVNTFFIYRTIRNLVNTANKHKNITVSIDDCDDFESSDVNYSEQAAFTELSESVWQSTETWHWYDKKLFNLYHTTDNTIRSLSEKTNISERSIWNTLNNGRQRIKIQCKKQYENWKRTRE